jgi:hypothetical protein
MAVSVTNFTNIRDGQRCMWMPLISYWLWCINMRWTWLPFDNYVLYFYYFKLQSCDSKSRRTLAIYCRRDWKVAIAEKNCGPHTATKKSLVYFSNGMDFIESTCVIALLPPMKSKKRHKRKHWVHPLISQFFCHTEQAVFPIQKSISPCPKQCVMVNHQQHIRYQT